MRRCLQVLWLAVLVGASPAAADRDVVREQSDQTVEVLGFTTLEIVNARGRVDLVPSPDAKIHLTALKIVRAVGRERAEELARSIVVETAIREGRYLIEVRYQKRHNVRINFWDFFKVDGVRLPGYEVRITCQVPRGLPVTVRESSGDIRSEGLSGAQVLKSSSGDIEVESAGGSLEVSSSSGDLRVLSVRQALVKSVSGDVVVRQAAGPLRVSTSSGDITVSGAGDSLTLASVSGDIRADRAPRGLDVGTSSGDVVAHGLSGSVRVGTSSGDVRLSLVESVRAVEAKTSSGEIRLQLDPAVGCALDMTTSSGTIDVNLPMQMKNVSRRHVSGSIRGGRAPVGLHTSSGDITVMGGGE